MSLKYWILNVSNTFEITNIKPRIFASCSVGFLFYFLFPKKDKNSSKNEEKKHGEIRTQTYKRNYKNQ